MNKVLLNLHTIELYSSVEEIPVENYIQHCRYTLIESGIGSTPESVGKHISLISGFIAAGSADKATAQLQNLFQSLLFASSSISPESKAFICLIKSINGEPYSDLSEEGINATIKRLSKKGLTIGKIRGYLKAFKKKIDQELEAYFPSISSPANVKESYTLLKRRTLLQLKSIAGEDVDEKINKVETRMYQKLNPKPFHGHGGAEVRFILSFEDSKLAISEVFRVDPNRMTVLSFYRGLETLKNRQDKMNKKSRLRV